MIWLGLGALWLALSCAVAQTDAPSNCDALAKSITEHFERSSPDAAKWVMKSLKPSLCSENLRVSQLDTVADFFNRMVEERMTPSGGLTDYLQTVKSLIEYRDSLYWNSWHDALAVMLSNKRWRKELPRFLKISPDLLFKGHLYAQRSHVWRVEGAVLKISSEGSPKVSFENGTLVAQNRSDTLRLNHVSASWDITKMRFQVSGGVLTWEGTSRDPLLNYAVLPSFELNLKHDGFKADSSVFHTDLYAQPLLGRVSTQLQESNNPDNRTYPRFETAQKILRLEALFPDIDYEGGLYVRGSKLEGYGTMNHPALLDIMRDDTVFVRLQSPLFLFKPEGFSSAHANLEVFFRQDTLSHPDVSVQFVSETGRHQWLRQSEGLGQQSFLDTYHNMEWDVEGLSWVVGSPLLKIGSAMADSRRTAVFRSTGFFRRSAFDGLSVIGDVHPLVELNAFVRETGRSGFTTEDYARFIHMGELQARIFLMNLANAGFVRLDTESLWCEILPKAIRYLRNSSGRRDYDVLEVVSSPRVGKNAEWSLLNGLLSIHGVNELQLSDSQNVRILPQDGTIVMAQNRDFTFDGGIRAGNFDFSGSDFSFDYDAFSIRFNQIEGVQMHVDDMQKRDHRGRPKKHRVLSKLEQVTGYLQVDHPLNRSGLRSMQYPEYPIFTSEQSSFVYFDQADLYDGAYVRDDFYYAVDPFVMKGLDQLDQSSLILEGVLVSGGIMPDVEEPLRVMDDYYLGLETETPPNGQVIYGGHARFTSGVRLDGQGLQGGGRVDFLTAEATGDQFVFLPDSVMGKTSVMANQADAQSNVPLLSGQRGAMVFRPEAREMELMSREDPLIFFGEPVELTGSVLLNEEGMRGSGSMFFENAQLQSDDFELVQRNIRSSSAEFLLEGEKGGIAAFRTDDVRCDIDFDERIGDFIPNVGETRIELPIQQYICFMDQFRWYMDEDEMDLISNRSLDELPFDFSEDRSISNFVSAHPDQDSLHFLSTRATYRIDDDVLFCQNVQELSIADSRIYPDSSLVTVRRNARMDDLEHARVVSNDVTRYHYIDDASLRVKGRFSYQGTGLYRYRDVTGDTSYIYLDEIAVNESLVTTGKGSVIARDGFALSPAFSFAGEVFMAADDPYLKFVGGAKMLQVCDAFDPQWIEFEGLINPHDVAIPIGSNPVDVEGDALSLGLMSTSRAPFDMYPGFLDLQSNTSDLKLMTGEGELRYEDGHYIVSTSEKLEQRNDPGNLIDLDAVTCRMVGMGLMSLPLNYDLAGQSFAGEFFIDAMGQYHLKGSLLMQFHFHQDLFERMALQIPSWLQAEPLDVASSGYEYALREWLGKEKAEKLITDLTMTGKLKNVPKELKNGLVITGLELVWDPFEEMFTSIGTIGIATLGKELVFHRVPGKVELIRSRSGDAFRLYFHGDEENWYYLDYKLGLLNASTRDIPFFDILTNIKSKRRKLKGKDGSRYLFQAMASRKRRDDMVDKYRDFD